MSCYLRHLDDILLAAGIRATKENQPRVHAIIQQITGEERCPQIWRSVKARLPREESWEEFVSQLRIRWQRPPAS